MTRQIDLHDVFRSPVHKEIVWQGEIFELHEKYGPINYYYSTQHIDSDYFARWKYICYEKHDRRGEVALCFTNAKNEILLHTKPLYPADTWRIPTGGIHEDEHVIDALHRETFEETGFKALSVHLLALLLYEFRNRQEALGFASYIFCLEVDKEQPQAQEEAENISGFKWIEPAQMPEVIASLKTLPVVKWRDWGRMRAVPHEILNETCCRRI